ncbi:MAG TPA: hypothetical protein EYP71_04280, partial [Dehalococcoidia bacterium]|nr:hypothetical protein [Dehalococcoidia bacterium]
MVRKEIFIFLGLVLLLSLVSLPRDAVEARMVPTPDLSASSLAALTTEEEALIDDIIRELDQARKLTDDRDIRDQIGIIRDWVKKMRGFAERGDTEAALEIKYTIAKRLEWLINQIPLSAPATTGAAAATAVQNPLYDELVRIRVKIDKLIAIEEREIPTEKPSPPPQLERPPEMERLLVYSAKFLCGPALGGEGVRPGSYSTAINIHNPHNYTVYLFKKAVVAQREDQPRGRISKFHRVKLGPNEAIEVDCIDIVRLLGVTTVTPQQAGVTTTQLQTAAVSPLASVIKFLKGFVVIYATAPLDVVGVYTGSTSVGFSLDIEHIPPSTVGVRPIPVPEKPEEEACPVGCYCMTKEAAYAKLGDDAVLCQEEPCGYDEQQTPLYCWKPAEEVCPQGCVCLTKDAAYERYGQYATLCQEEPCGKDA